MSETYATITINNEPYEILGVFELSYVEGSGEDEEKYSWDWTHLRHKVAKYEVYAELKYAEDKKEAGIYYLNKNVTFSQLEKIAGGQVTERIEGVKIKTKLSHMIKNLVSLQDVSESPWEHGRVNLEYITFDTGKEFDVPDLFSDADDYLIINGTELLHEVEIVEYNDGQYYTRDHPARQVEPYDIPIKKPATLFNTLLNLSVYVAALSVVVSNFIASYISPGFPRLYDMSLETYYLPGVACLFLLGFIGRRNILYSSIKILATAFSLAISLSLLRNMALDTTSPGYYISILYIAFMVFPAIVLLISRKAYAVLSDTAINSATYVLIIYTILMTLYSFIDEYWWLEHYSYYLGHVIWGSIWIFLFMFILIGTYGDYKHAPMDVVGLVDYLNKLSAELISSTPDFAHIKRLTDDIEDSLRISPDSRIVTFANLIGEFSRLNSYLRKIDAERDGRYLAGKYGFQALSEDVENYAHIIRNRDDYKKCQSLRLSPELLSLKVKYDD